MSICDTRDTLLQQEGSGSCDSWSYGDSSTLYRDSVTLGDLLKSRPFNKAYETEKAKNTAEFFVPAYEHACNSHKQFCALKAANALWGSTWSRTHHYRKHHTAQHQQQLSNMKKVPAGKVFVMVGSNTRLTDRVQIHDGPSEPVSKQQQNAVNTVNHHQSSGYHAIHQTAPLGDEELEPLNFDGLLTEFGNPDDALHSSHVYSDQAIAPGEHQTRFHQESHMQNVVDHGRLHSDKFANHISGQHPTAEEGFDDRQQGPRAAHQIGAIIEQCDHDIAQQSEEASSDVDIEIIDDTDTDTDDESVSVYQYLQQRIAKRQKLEAGHRSHLNLLSQETQLIQSSQDDQLLTVNQRRNAVSEKQARVDHSQRCVEKLRADLDAKLNELQNEQQDLVALEFQLGAENSLLLDLQTSATQKRNGITKFQARTSFAEERLKFYEKVQALLPEDPINDS